MIRKTKDIYARSLAEQNKRSISELAVTADQVGVEEIEDAPGENVQEVLAGLAARVAALENAAE